MSKPIQKHIKKRLKFVFEKPKNVFIQQSRNMPFEVVIRSNELRIGTRMNRKYNSIIDKKRIRRSF